MTQIVCMHIWKIVLLQQLFEFCIHIGSIHVLAVFASENRTPVNPSVANILFSLLLPVHLLCQRFHSLWRQGNHSCTAFRFRSAKLVLSLAAIKAVPDCQCRVLKIHIRPVQPCNFTNTHSREQQHSYKPCELRIAKFIDDSQKLFALF